MRWEALWVFAGALAVGVGCTPGTTQDTGSQVEEEVEAAYHLTPPSSGRGISLDVVLHSDLSRFVFGDTWVDLGPGVSVESVTVQDGFRAIASVTVDPDADLGPRDATIRLQGREIYLPGAFRVTAETFRVEPDAAKMGETVYVTLVGTDTQWVTDYTWANFGDSIRVLSVDVVSPTLAEARIAIRPDAAPGPRDVAVETGPQVVTRWAGFRVDRAVLTAFWQPPEAYQGETINFAVTGLDTNFTPETTLEFWDDGGLNPDVQVVDMTVLDATHIEGRVRLSNAARIGMRDVLVTMGEEAVLIPEALNVLDAPPDLSNVYPVIGFDVYRQIDNTTGDLLESVEAYAYFVIPLDPPCGAGGSGGDGPAPYDQNGVWPVPPPPEPVDCPNPDTLSAGPVVWFEGPENIVTLHRDIIPATGQILYRGRDLTLADYHFGMLYDLRAPGDPAGIPAFHVPQVQPTVPGDYYILTPTFANDFTQSRAEDLNYTWTPAQTYPDAVFSTQISGTLVADGEPGFAGSLPWDDGDHTYTPAQLSQLEAGPVSFSASSYIQGPYFGLPFSTVQIARSDSVLATSASLSLE